MYNFELSEIILFSIELCLKYCVISLTRWDNHGGDTPVRALWRNRPILRFAVPTDRTASKWSHPQNPPNAHQDLECRTIQRPLRDWSGTPFEPRTAFPLKNYVTIRLWSVPLVSDPFCNRPHDPDFCAFHQRHVDSKLLLICPWPLFCDSHGYRIQFVTSPRRITNSQSNRFSVAETVIMSLVFLIHVVTTKPKLIEPYDSRSLFSWLIPSSSVVFWLLSYFMGIKKLPLSGIFLEEVNSRDDNSMGLNVVHHRFTELFFGEQQSFDFALFRSSKSKKRQRCRSEWWFDLLSSRDMWYNLRSPIGFLIREVPSVGGRIFWFEKCNVG
jgi:hypothetical protein